MKRIVSLLLVLLMCFSFVGAARPGKQASASAGASTMAQAALKKGGTEITSASSLAMYDVVTFGQYPQSAGGERADIEWIVMGFDGSERVKLLSSYALDTQRFHDTKDTVSWTSTALYLWLNGSFRETAFSQEEQALLSGAVSIPSVEEAQALPASYLKCSSTPYAIAQGGDPTRCIWWLNNQFVKRDKENEAGEKKYFCYASVVNQAGKIAKGAMQVNYHGKVVRPTIIVDLNADAAQERAAAPVQRNGQAIHAAADLKMNDTITFGRYIQSPNAAPTEIEWVVAGINGDQVKLIALYALDAKKYNETHVMVTWPTSTLFAWLNDGFRSAAFTADEQALLVDGVTLPDATDAESMPATLRSCLPTAYAFANGISEKECIWWLSEPTRLVKFNSSLQGWCASAVKGEGGIVKASYQINFGGKGVRPMVILDLSKLS